MQLAAFNNNNFALGHTAMAINEGLPLYLVDRLKQRYDLGSMAVGILGMAFKGGSDDIRSSLAYKLKRILAFDHRRGVLHRSARHRGCLADAAGRRGRQVGPADHRRPARRVRERWRTDKPIVDIWNIRGDGGARVMAKNRAAAQQTAAADLVRRARISDPDALRVSIVIPAYNEGENIIPVLERLFEAVTLPCEVLVVVDDPADTTRPVVQRLAETEPRLHCLINTYGRGPANAIRYGIDHATTPVAVVTMADGCDDVRQIDDLVRLVERGVAVAAASRYMAGGQQVGGPLLKGMMSAGGRAQPAAAGPGRAPGTPPTRSRPIRPRSSGRSASTAGTASRSASS